MSNIDKFSVETLSTTLYDMLVFKGFIHDLSDPSVPRGYFYCIKMYLFDKHKLVLWTEH